MMRTTIARKLVETSIEGYFVKVRDGEPIVQPLETLVLYGNFNKAEALRELKRVYGKLDGLTVSKITAETKQFEISVNDFVKYAKVVDKSNTI